MKKRGFLGYPEPDGAIPFAFSVQLETGFFVVIGIVNREYRDVSEIQSTIFNDITETELIEYFAQQGLQSVSFSALYWLFCFMFPKEYPFVEFEIIALEEAKAMEPQFRKVEYDAINAMQTKGLMHPKTGVFFALPEDILQDGIRGLAVAFHNDEAVQEQLIEAVVDSCAEMVLTDEQRNKWSIVLDALSILYMAYDDRDNCSVAQNNRKALDLGALGSQVPFIRNWVNQQLLNSVAIAQLMAREELQAKKS